MEVKADWINCSIFAGSRSSTAALYTCCQGYAGAAERQLSGLGIDCDWPPLPRQWPLQKHQAKRPDETDLRWNRLRSPAPERARLSPANRMSAWPVPVCALR